MLTKDLKWQGAWANGAYHPSSVTVRPSAQPIRPVKVVR